MNDLPKPSKIETEECFVIKCIINGEYIIGDPALVGVNFHSFDLDTAIRQYSFKTRPICERQIAYLEERYSDWIKQWAMRPEVAFRLKGELNLL